MLTKLEEAGEKVTAVGLGGIHLLLLVEHTHVLLALRVELNGCSRVLGHRRIELLLLVLG